MRALLVVNVLIALLDRGHFHHAIARAWLERNGASGWASCAITQNGCVRVMSQRHYPRPLPTAAVITRLAAAASHPSHAFWPSDITLLDPACANANSILGPAQVTDVYLLSLAVHHGGRFVTFDAAVPIDAVPGARPEHLLTL